MVESNNIEIHSTYNEGKSPLSKQLEKLQLIYQHVIAISKNVFADYFPKIVKKYFNTIHTKINMKPIDVKLKIYINIPFESNLAKSKI